MINIFFIQDKWEDLIESLIMIVYYPTKQTLNTQLLITQPNPLP